jgi:ABC-2 type transport system permease protein
LPFQEDSTLLNVRGHLATVRVAAFGPLADGLWILGALLPQFVRVLILLAVWRTLIPPGAEVAGYHIGTVLTYSLFGAVFAVQLDVRTPVAEALWTGAIANRFTWPMPVATQYAAEMIGEWTSHIVLVSIPLLLLAPALGVDARPASAADLLLFLISLGLAIVVGLAIDMAYAVLTVGVDLGPRSFQAVRAVLQSVCSGAWIPLALLPFHLGGVFRWLPFASAASAPLVIYTGAGDPLPLILTQLAWALVLGLAVCLAWRSIRERMALYGG